MSLYRAAIFAAIIGTGDTDGYRRAHHITQHGKPNRRYLWRYQPMAYVSHLRPEDGPVPRYLNLLIRRSA